MTTLHHEIVEAPGTAPSRRMLGVLRHHPGPFGSRAEAVATVESEGFSPLVANWMATNVVRENPDALQRLLARSL